MSSSIAPPRRRRSTAHRAVVPYIALSLILLALMIAFPAITIWLSALLG